MRAAERATLAIYQSDLNGFGAHRDRHIVPRRLDGLASLRVVLRLYQDRPRGAGGEPCATPARGGGAPESLASLPSRRVQACSPCSAPSKVVMLSNSPGQGKSVPCSYGPVADNAAPAGCRSPSICALVESHREVPGVSFSASFESYAEPIHRRWGRKLLAFASSAAAPIRPGTVAPHNACLRLRFLPLGRFEEDRRRRPKRLGPDRLDDQINSGPLAARRWSVGIFLQGSRLGVPTRPRGLRSARWSRSASPRP